MIRKITLGAIATLALAACAETQEVDETNEPTEVLQDEADIAVIPSLQDVGEANMDLGDEDVGVCRFEADGATLLVAAAPEAADARGVGVAQMNGQLINLEGTELGGPDAISAGPMLTGDEYTFDVNRAEIGTDASVESTSYEATLTVRREGMSEVAYGPGTWTCGV
ncbi:hypothetical protein [Aurantiacibacter poecillastricola]|uniref:hypothetical protein n=1 Tax=Aurantiacibacter poecillastricola TaxID=3064385 RepID=UPI00273EC7CE|nr:hypothetical protein [Aurantiacibacter sp. 219JJ12-13]MDP5262129.1 hypothetical protein [Aurantiacibacter sp. 219JJ12-13]